jgi:integrase
MKTAITKATIKAAKPQAEKYLIWDEQTPGLAVRVMPSGVKSWVYKYRTIEGVQQWRTIGRVEALHPDQARTEAAKTMLAVRSGEDPAAELRTRRDGKTVADLVAAFRTVHFSLVKPNTALDYERLIRNHIEPRFGSRRLDSLELDDMRQWKADTASTPYVFNRARALLSMMIDYGIEKKWVKGNILRTRRLRNFKEIKRKRYMTVIEGPRVGEALKTYGIQSDIRWRFTALITLLLITGCRAGEIAKARWDWVDWENKRINWPDTKTGQDQNALPDLAMTLLSELRLRNPGNPWVIAGARIGHPLIGYKKMWREVRKMAKVDDLRIHDLRKSFASVALAEGVSLEVIGSLLRHANPNITAERYSFLMEDARRPLLNTTAQAVLDRLS